MKAVKTPAHSAANTSAVNSVEVSWIADERFSAARPGGPAIELDSHAKTGPSPFEALLMALGGCTSVDVVEILAKRRTPVRSCTVRVEASRFDGTPRRVTAATLHFNIAGAGIERVHAERAIDLAITKYCSVRDSLRQDIPIEWTLTLDSSDAPA